MAKMIQIRNVPDALYRTLRVRAARAGISLADYLMTELRELADRPTMEEFAQRLGDKKQ